MRTKSSQQWLYGMVVRFNAKNEITTIVRSKNNYRLVSEKMCNNWNHKVQLRVLNDFAYVSLFGGSFRSDRAFQILYSRFSSAMYDGFLFIFKPL